MKAKTKQKRKINVTIRSTASVIKEVLDTCHAAEKGLPIPEAERELTFNDAATMLSTLSEKRMEMLMFLHDKASITIKELSRQLRRNYSNVHEDVQLLLRLGLLETDKDKKVFVPWDELNLTFPFLLLPESPGYNNNQIRCLAARQTKVLTGRKIRPRRRQGLRHRDGR